MSLGAYFAEDLKIGTIHGICPECRKKVVEDTRHFHKKRLAAAPQATAGGGDLVDQAEWSPGTCI